MDFVWHNYTPSNEKKRKETPEEQATAKRVKNAARTRQKRAGKKKVQDSTAQGLSIHPNNYLGQYYKCIDEAITRSACNCCGQLVPSKEVTRELPLNSEVLRPLKLSPNEPPLVVFEEGASGDKVKLCNSCSTVLDGGKLPSASVANKLFFGPVPECLKCLNEMEKRMIARVCCFISMRVPPGRQQRHTRGHAINLFNKPGDIAKKLPRTADQSGIVIVRPPSDSAYHGLSEFVARPHLIRQALVWLKANNWLYADVEIDEEMLSSLEQNSGVVPPTVSVQDEDIPVYAGSHQDVEDHDPLGPSLETCLIQENNDSRHINEILGDLLPGRPLSQPTQMPTIPAVLPPSALPSGNIVEPIPAIEFPSLRDVVNEYTSSSYVGMAFPWLFPYGTGLPDDVRPIPLGLPEYFKSLVHYHDRRFATDPLFVFWATNTLQRSQASKVIKVAGSRLEDKGYQLNAGLLREAGNGARGTKTVSKEAQQLLNLLVPYFDAVKDSAPFWKARKREVMAMMSSSSLKIKTPSWFVTFSPADVYWPEFFAMVDSTLVGDKLHSLETREREQIVADNPDLAILCFKARWDAIFEFIMGPCHPLGQITDWYYKVEYQGRGSPHVHAIFWADLGCDTEQLLKSSEGLSQLATIIEQYSTAWFSGDVVDSNAPLPQPLVHPAFKRAELVFGSPGWEKDVEEIVSCCQVHSHKPTCYKGRSNPDRVCRFHFPFEPTPTTQINIEEGATLQNMQVLYKRNHRWINRYNPLLLSLWRGNMDCSFIGNPYGVAYYAAAYAAKGEPNRIAFRDKLTKGLTRLGEDTTIHKSLKAVAFAALGAREMSLQECLWIISGYKCTGVSRTFEIINATRPEARNKILKSTYDLVAMDDTDNDIFSSSATAKLCEAYSNRPQSMEDLTLCEFAAKYQTDSSAPTSKTTLPRFALRNGSWVAQRKQLAVVLLFPCIAFDISNEESAWAILFAHIPWLKLDYLLRGKLTAVEALAAAIPLLSPAHQEHISIATREYNVRKAAREQRRQDGANSSNSSREYTAEDSSHPASSVFLSADIGAQMLFEEATSIASEPSDVPPDHFRPRRVYSADDIQKASSFVSEQEKLYDEARMAQLQQFNLDNNNNPQQHARQQKLAESVSKLNDDQRLGYKVIEHHFRAGKQLVMSIIGGAGTGKSFLIDVVILLALLVFGNTGGKWGPILKTAYTGIAAFNIGGVTLSSAFKLPVGKDNVDPSPEVVKTLQQQLCGLRVLVIDEISMVSAAVLNKLDRLLKLVFPEHGSEPFGGLHVLLAGDFFQIPPVRVKGLHEHSNHSGRQVWLNCTASITLRIQQRQQHGDVLGEICNRARTGDSTAADISMLNNRYLPAAIPPDALYTSPTNEAVDALNRQKLQQLNRPTVTLWARHIPSAQNSAGTLSRAVIDKHSSLISGEAERSNKFRGLYNHINLAVGARIMIQRNIATPLGLVNGATGTVYDFIYNPAAGPAVPHATYEQAAANPQLQLPIVLVQIDAEFYTGLSFVEGIDRVVPVCPVKVYNASLSLERHQLPLTLAWGLTVHKVQGLTLGKIAVHLPKVHDRGLAYVAISRVKKLENLYLHCPLKPNIFALYAERLAAVKAESNRLAELDAATRAKYADL